MRCDTCDTTLTGKYYTSVREIEVGRSSGSITFGSSNSKGSSSRGSSNRHRNGWLYNTGRTYYRNIQVRECEICYMERKAAEKARMKLIIYGSVALLISCFLLSLCNPSSPPSSNSTRASHTYTHSSPTPSQSVVVNDKPKHNVIEIPSIESKKEEFETPQIQNNETKEFPQLMNNGR